MIQSLSELWQWTCSQLASGSVWVWIAAVTLFLVGSALTLAYTRFGQQKPVLTCVGLSVLAHLLLGAMLSRLILTNEVVGHGKGEFASVQVMEFDESTGDDLSEPDETVDDPAAAVTAELGMDSTPPPAPELDQLPRPEHDTELIIEPVPSPEMDPGAPDSPLLESRVPEALESAAAPPAAPTAAGMIAAAENQAETTPETVSPVPEPIAPERMAESLPVDPLQSPELAGITAPPPMDPALPTPAPEAAEPGLSAPDQQAGIPVPPGATSLAEQSITPPEESPVPEAIPLLDTASRVPAAVVSGPMQLPDLARRGGISGSMSPIQPADLKPLPIEYALRAAPDKTSLAIRRGGSAETEAAVRSALEWLARTQATDGRWDPRLTGGGVEYKVLGHDRQNAGSHADTGITGLALLAFLSGGHTHLEGAHREVVRKGIDFLVSQQSADGCLAGDARLFERMYCHSMALLALGEAVAMTGDETLKPALRSGVGFSLRSQSRLDGGWRYQPGDAGDLSQFGWVVLGLRSAALAGMEIPSTSTAGMEQFLQACTRGQFQGLASYRPNEAITPTMTAEGLVCRYLLERTPRRETVAEAAGYLMRSLPSEDHINYYYWYYGTMALYQAGGPEWENWNAALTQVLVARQIMDGEERGAWPADGVWSGYGGKVYSTAMATLCLEVYYRYMPVYEALRQAPAETNR